jgi:CO/xanthine dehydrogenase FAD-binding subunit
VSATAETIETVLAPRTLREALEMKRDRPDAVVIAGGTDIMVAVNFDRLRPPAFLDVSGVPELREWLESDGRLLLGAGVTFARIVRELAGLAPLVQASRTVGSPQIRNRGTVGGNLGTASPAGDALPVLAAYDADVVVSSAERGERVLPWHEFLTGPKRNALEPDELITGTSWAVTRGPGSFSKIGTRNAMVIAVANLTLVVDERTRSIRVALGSVGPTILRAREAEGFAQGLLADEGLWDDPARADSGATSGLDRFGDLVAGAIRPIDDVRGSEAYRRHACRVLARRALAWALEERAGSGRPVS